jgi:cyclohexanone monooxygenase
MSEPKFDPASIRHKYRQERAKRLSDERQQIIALQHGEFAEYLDDPYSARIERESLRDEVSVVVIGGGFGGLLIGAQLRQAGVRSIRIIEQGGDFGGTWYWNRYPAAQCDVESYIYLPLLEELGYMPRERYSFQPEIYAHAQRIGHHFDLYRDACFHTHVTGLRWDSATQRWQISTDRGDAMRAQFVCVATGPLSRPKLPAIPGIASFEGASFHTSRWDYGYTGGSQDGRLNNLTDKTVGIIGTGATAIQCITPLAQYARRLLVFQRTPSTIGYRGNRPTDPKWAAGLGPGWQRHRMENFTNVVGGDDVGDLVQDGWTRAVREIYGDADVLALPADQRAEAIELADFKLSEQLRARIDEFVKDKAVAEALKPWYFYFCKRPCFHDEYFPAFNRPNVELIDTDGCGVEEITPDGVIVGGEKHELECLVFATGFEVGSAHSRPAEYEITGRGGLTLAGKFAAGMSSLHGMMTRDFPNLFFTPAAFTPGMFSQSVRCANYVHSLVEVSEHIGYIVKTCVERGIESVDVSEAAESAWVATIVAGPSGSSLGLRGSLDYLKRCTPSYLNNEGKPEEVRPQDRAFGGSAREFFALLRDWRASGELPGLEQSC